MANISILGQVSPTLNTETFLYSGSTSFVANTLTVCNRTNTTAQFRVSISQGGAATQTKDYIYYDLYIGGNDTFAATMGITGAATDTIRVYSSTSNLTFNLFGQTN